MAASLEFADWYTREYSRVYRAVLSLAADSDVARDCTDEAFTRALERWNRVARMDRPGGWVTVVALNHLRRRRRREALERRLLRRDPDVHSLPEADIDRATSSVVWAAVSQLPDRQRQTTVLRFVGDLTERQIAFHLGISRNTVASTLRDARQTLERQLDPLHAKRGSSDGSSPTDDD
jgi:RNA polymerase sigma-70 factor (ECF subfamily)